MDPNTCLKRYFDAIAAGDTEEAIDAAADYGIWIDGGGFMGEITVKIKVSYLGRAAVFDECLRRIPQEYLDSRV